jgi:Icc-related predicted phosphoesterase
MQIVCISDTHEFHRDVEVPDGDLLIHAGDFTYFSKRPSMLFDFDDWLGELPHEHKVVVPGNHEFLLEDPQHRPAITNATLLIDAGIEIEGIKIWGSPVTPLYGVAFGMSSGSDRKRTWAKIPDATDILITHSPPFGFLDRVSVADGHQGCLPLMEAVLRVRPRLHVFGHIHRGYGTKHNEHTLFVNAALSDKFGGVGRPPIIVDFEALKRSFDR